MLLQECFAYVDYRYIHQLFIIEVFNAWLSKVHGPMLQSKYV